MHLALNTGLLPNGSKNVSEIHWDMLKDMRESGEIFANGKLIYTTWYFVKFH